MDLEPVVAEAFSRLEDEGVDAFEVAGISEQTLSVEAKRQMVESFERSSSAGIALRVVCKKKNLDGPPLRIYRLRRSKGL